MKKFIVSMLLILCVGLFCVGCTNTDNDTQVTITFKQEGEEDIVKEILKGEDLIDVPTPEQIEGYTVVWDVTDFNKIKNDMTVNAVVTANTYKINFDYSGISCDGEPFLEVKYKEQYVLPTPINALGVKIFVRWVNSETNQTVVDGVYSVAGDITLKAIWDDLYISE